MGPIGSSETSVSNHHTPHNNPKHGRIQFNPRSRLMSSDSRVRICKKNSSSTDCLSRMNPSKRRETLSQRHGVTSHKTYMFGSTADRTSSVTVIPFLKKFVSSRKFCAPGECAQLRNSCSSESLLCLFSSYCFWTRQLITVIQGFSNTSANRSNNKYVTSCWQLVNLCDLFFVFIIHSVNSSTVLLELFAFLWHFLFNFVSVLGFPHVSFCFAFSHSLL
jgi:hypothetical protein